MKFFDAEKTAAALTYPELIDALRCYFSTDIEAPLRHVHAMPNKDEHDPMLLLKPAWAKDGEFGGTKLLTFTPDNGQRNLPAIDGAYVLFSREDGSILALMDAKPMTAKRTAAASALAADYLARKDAKVHLVIGSGAVGSELPHAHRAVRDIERTLIWSRDEQGAKKLVEKLNQQGLKAEHCADLEAGVGRRPGRHHIAAGLDQLPNRGFHSRVVQVLGPEPGACQHRIGGNARLGNSRHQGRDLVGRVDLVFEGRPVKG